MVRCRNGSVGLDFGRFEVIFSFLLRFFSFGVVGVLVCSFPLFVRSVHG